jgi:hypothetical protein
MAVPSTGPSRALWRRQVVLTALVAVALGGVSMLSSRIANAHDRAVAARRLRLPEPDTTWLTVASVVATIILVALLVAACVHAFHIAQLTFRRGETD